VFAAMSAVSAVAGDCFLNSLPALKNAKNCVAKPQLP
jgi:hypothetical protein